MSDLSVYFTNSGFYRNYTADENIGDLAPNQATDREVIQEALGIVKAGPKAPKAALDTITKYCTKESEVSYNEGGTNSMHAQLMSCIAVKVVAGRLPVAQDDYTAGIMEGVDSWIDGAKAFAKATAKPEETRSGLSSVSFNAVSFKDAVYSTSLTPAFAFAVEDPNN